MLQFILRRALHSLIALVGLLIAVFVLTRLTGDPAALYLPEEASAEQRAAYAVQMGYSDPIYMQFFRYVEGLLRFDFGISMRQQRSAMIEPLIMPTAMSPATVMIGSHELRRAWPSMARRLRPLALAVFT